MTQQYNKYQYKIHKQKLKQPDTAVNGMSILEIFFVIL